MPFNKIVKKTFNSYFLTLFLLIIAFILRYYKFDSVGFWGDEYITFWLSEPFQSYNQVLEKILSSPEKVPPFYYYTLSIFNYLFEYSASYLRLFHIFFGFLCVIVVFFISRFLLSKSGNNLVIYLLSFNLFLIWSSTEVRVVSFALFFQLLSIFVFLKNIKSLNHKNFYINLFVLILINILALTIHPLSISIIISQFLFFLIIIFKKKSVLQKKFFYIHLACIILSIILYILINKTYYLSSLETTRLSHNQLTLNFFVGYNFKHYFSSYVLGLINLLIIILTFFSLRKKIFKNLYLLYLLILFLFTYIFIITGTLMFTGMNSQRYWSYLVPIITIINIYYLTEIKKNIYIKLIILTLIIYTPYICIKNYNYPQVRKPNTPELIKLINNSNIENIVSNNYGLFENYLKKGYKNFNKNIISESQISQIKNDFWYLCLDLTWHQSKGSYWNEMYDCSTRDQQNIKFIKAESVRLNGYVVTKYKIKK